MMIDLLNPTNQFHPYQKPEDVPPANELSDTLKVVLGRLGVEGQTVDTLADSVRTFEQSETVRKARRMIRGNAPLILGGMAALAIGAGLIRRQMSHAAPVRGTR